FAETAPFPVRLYVNEQNLGSTRNFEKAIGLCEGELIALSDQDDVWLPEKLRRTEEVLIAGPEIGALFTDAELVDKDLQPLGKRLWSVIKFDRARQRMVREGRAFELLCRYNVVTGATMAFRSKFRDLVLPIPPLDKYIHDGWIALMISAVARLAFITEPMILYRQHPGQQMSVEWKALPPEESGTDGSFSGLIKAARRTHPFAEEIRKYDLIHERLIAQGRQYDTRARVAQVRPKIDHLRARTTLPDSRLKRVPRVVRELLTMRYHQYSRGLCSAAKDLLH
ncbi:MAG: glycosyltransferase, partial [Rubrivivax sp.]|nr:glycosyltransferase [Pyrinomonadaceae bacterium]